MVQMSCPHVTHTGHTYIHMASHHCTTPACPTHTKQTPPMVLTYHQPLCTVPSEEGNGKVTNKSIFSVIVRHSLNQQTLEALLS